jgi:hypothetical protein
MVVEAALGLIVDHAARMRPHISGKNPGATARIAARLSALLNSATAGDDFTRLFEVRSQFIHGRQMANCHGVNRRPASLRSVVSGGFEPTLNGPHRQRENIGRRGAKNTRKAALPVPCYLKTVPCYRDFHSLLFACLAQLEKSPKCPAIAGFSVQLDSAASRGLRFSPVFFPVNLRGSRSSNGRIACAQTPKRSLGGAKCRSPLWR